MTAYLWAAARGMPPDAPLRIVKKKRESSQSVTYSTSHRWFCHTDIDTAQCDRYRYSTSHKSPVHTQKSPVYRWFCHTDIDSSSDCVSASTACRCSGEKMTLKKKQIGRAAARGPDTAACYAKLQTQTRDQSKRDLSVTSTGSYHWHEVKQGSVIKQGCVVKQGRLDYL